MRYYIIAGELSGDLHAAFLVRELKKNDINAVFRGFGGDKMKEEGVMICRHIKDLAFMGFVEVLANIGKVLNNIKICKADILNYKPDCIICVDYPNFNFRIATFAKKHDIKTFHYISPSVWAWKKGRIKKMKNILDRLYVILPFEKSFYAKNGMEVEYFGNPLLDEINEFRTKQQSTVATEKPLIVLMPGSRTQEIKKMLPLQMKLVENYPQFDFVIAGVPTHSREFYEEILQGLKIKITFNETYSLLNIARAAIITSGTATLEAALFGVPQVVCYRANAISFIIGRFIANVKYISLVNLILNRLCVVELLQKDCNNTTLNTEFNKIVFNNCCIQKMLNDYREIRDMLGNAGASAKIAEDIVKILKYEKDLF